MYRVETSEVVPTGELVDVSMEMLDNATGVQIPRNNAILGMAGRAGLPFETSNLWTISSTLMRPAKVVS